MLYYIITSTLSPANTGGAVPANNYAQVSTFATVLSEAITADATGNIYILANTLLLKITPSGVVTTLAGHLDENGFSIGKSIDGPGAYASFDTPLNITIDRFGYLYVVDDQRTGDGSVLIRKVSPDGIVSTLATSSFPTENVNSTKFFLEITGIAVDGSGNIYLANYGAMNSGAVLKINPSGIITVLAGASGFSGYDNGIGTAATFSSISAITADAAGIVYVADAGMVRKITSSGVVSTVAGQSTIGYRDGTGTDAAFYPSWGLAIDSAKNLYISDYSFNTIRRINSSGTVSTLAGMNSTVASSTDGIGSAAGFWEPREVAVDGTGHLYVMDQNYHVMRKITTTGYSISPALPAGLIFDGTTGSIGGTPTMASPAANYTISAYNTSGSSSAVVSIGVSPGTDLSALTTTAGLLSPAFSAATTAYTVNVPNSTAAITVTPSTVIIGDTIKVNGTIVASGAASASLVLTAGNNGINIVVKAPGGIAAKTYTITVNRAPSSNAVLTKIATNSGVVLAQVTGTDYKDYAITVQNGTSSIKITPTAQDATATIKVNGATVASGTASAAIPLAVGSTVINTVVTAQDGVTVKNYSITVTRLSNNALLTKLATNSGVALTQVAGSDYKDFTLSLPNTTASIAIIPTAQDATATIKVNGATVTSGTASAAINIPVGTTIIKTVVTAQDGLTVKTYGITVTRASGGSNNALLTKIATNSGVVLTASSGPDYKDYTINVPNSTSSITITPTTQDATATVKVNGVTVASGTASAAIPLKVGNTVISTVITAQDGVTTKTYGITATRAAMFSLYEPTDSIALDGLTIHPGITPNGDGINDIFNIDGINSYPDNKVTIMSHSGAVVYEAKGYDNQTKFFDGHSNKNGTMQLPGTYFYSLEYTSNGKIKVKTGFLVLKY